jgi:predicted nucleic acid-binding protein
MSYLVDANVLCEATRPQAERQVLVWLEWHDAALHVSVITLGKIFKGICLLPAGSKQRRLKSWFAGLESSFEGRILPLDQPVMREWAVLYSRWQRSGRLLSSFDSLLAATASFHGLTVATRNRSDFPPDLPLINPWGDS